jgi:hypothetical protein
MLLDLNFNIKISKNDNQKYKLVHKVNMTRKKAGYAHKSVLAGLDK